jgi:hypothetical protein
MDLVPYLPGRVRAREGGFAGRVERSVEERASQNSTGDDWVTGEEDEAGGDYLRLLAGSTRREERRRGGLNSRGFQVCGFGIEVTG